MASDRRGWRLLSDLNNIFRRDPNIDEFDFIPVAEPRHNRSPIVLVDHKLGLELWSVKILYQYVYHTLMDWRSRKTKTFIEPQELAGYTRAALLFNPECYTLWNIRKELIESGDIVLLDELKLGALILTKHPKSSETFTHRRWVLSRFIENHLESSQGSTRSTGSGQDGFINMEAIDLNLDLPVNPLHNGHNDLAVEQQRSEYHAQMKTEMAVCTGAAERYPCNYYSWSYRIWLIQHCFNCSVQALLSELRSTEGWVGKHVSDYCGYHYRQFLLSGLASQAASLSEVFSIRYSNLLQKEHHLIMDLIQAFPAHEAMWNHRKFVFHSLYKLYDSDSKLIIDESETTSFQKKKRLETDRQVLEQNEIDMVTKTDLKSSNLYHKRLAQTYLDWLQKAVIK